LESPFGSQVYGILKESAPGQSKDGRGAVGKVEQLVDKASRQIYRICPKYHRQMVPTGCMFGKMVSTLVFDWRSGNQFQLLFPAPAFYLGFPLQGSRFCGKLFGVNYF